MKKHIKYILALLLICSMVFTACGQTGNTDSSENPSASESPIDSSEAPELTVAPDDSSSTSTAEPAHTPEPAVEKVTLNVDTNSKGNKAYVNAHYGIPIIYTGEYVTLINYKTLMQHGADIEAAPQAVDGFEYQGEDAQYHNGNMYFLIYDFNDTVYHLYSYDFENTPVKVTNSTVYHYMIIGDKIYYTKESFQGPIYSMNIDGTGETELTQMRSHSFVYDNGSLYFYSTDVGTAPGIVEYNISTGEEKTVVFPFYSHNYLVHDGYVYFVYDGTYRSIHRQKLNDDVIEDLWLEISDYTISMNMTDGMLYLLVGSGIYSCNPDGSNRVELYKSDEYLKTGLYVFDNRIYARSDYDLIAVDLNDGKAYLHAIY